MKNLFKIYDVSFAGMARSGLARRFAVLAFSGLLFIAPATAALADLSDGLKAFQGGDYVNAVRELQVPAYDGNSIAQFHLGVMYAKGLGVSQNSTDALKWFLCAEAGSLPADLKRKALEWRRMLYSDLALLDMDYAERSAANGCRSADAPGAFDQGYRRYEIESAVPQRSGVIAVLLFPGDVTMRGILVVLDETGISAVMEATLKLIEGLGDVLFGFLALLGWALIARVGYLIATSFQEWFLDRKQRASSSSTGRGGAQGGPPRKRASPTEN